MLINGCACYFRARSSAHTRLARNHNTHTYTPLGGACLLETAVSQRDSILEYVPSILVQVPSKTDNPELSYIEFSFDF